MQKKVMAKTQEPIIILGFGRSGTTWISDIVSKSLGGLVLFEPFHPEVFKIAKESCYHNASNKNLLKEIKTHTKEFLSKKQNNKWLIRNHLSSNLEQVNADYANAIWENCEIIGYKSIRQNLMIPWLYENVSSKIVFIKRDLLSVISSILKRKRFWEEFGFDFHEEKFLYEIFESDTFPFLKKDFLLTTYKSLKEDYLKMTFIWVITHQIVEHDLQKLNLPIFNYSSFYETPYKATQDLLNYLGCKNKSLHPSYIFTPSMLTLKTFHEFTPKEKLNNQNFWSTSLSSKQAKEITVLQEKLHNQLML